MAYSTEILSDSPAGYWRLGESSGTSAADASGNGNAGTYINSPTLSVASLVALDSDTCATFTRSSSQQVDVAAAASIDNLFAGGGTLEFLCRPTSVVGAGASSARVVSKDAGSTDATSSLRGWAVSYDGDDNSFNFYQRFSNGVDAVSDALWKTPTGSHLHDVIAHVQITYDSSSTSNTPIIRINGVTQSLTQVASPTGGHSASDDSSSKLVIGNMDQAASAGDRFFDGEIDEVSVTGTALSTARLDARYLETVDTIDLGATIWLATGYGVAVGEYSPMLQWRLNESSGSTATDASGNANDGTINGVPTYGLTGALVLDSDKAMGLAATSADHVVAYGIAALSGADALTILLHIDSEELFGSLFEIRSGGSDYLRVSRTDSGTTITIRYSKLGTVYYEVFTATITPWTMLAVVYDAGELVLYVDGSPVTPDSSTGTKSTSLFPAAADVWLSRTAAGDEFPANYDEFSVIGSVLTADDIATLYEIASRPVTEQPISPDLDAIVWLATNMVELSAGIELDTRLPLNLFAVVDLFVSDTVDLAAAIDLDTRLVDLSATISLNPKVAISPNLSATISLETASQALADAAGGFWLPVCMIDGVDVSGQLTGEASFEYEEDASGIGTVTLSPPDGSVDLSDYVGKRITYKRQDLDAAGSLQYEKTLFAGYISEPVFDPDTGDLSLECTTDIQGAFDGKTRAQIEAIVGGTWSPHVFEEGAQGYDYAMDRMRTRAASLWHSPGGIVVTEWAAKATADIEFDDNDVIEDSIEYEIATRRDLLNKVAISFDYRFQRMRQRTINCLFSMSQSFCDLLINGFKIPQRSMIESAANGGGWVVQGDIQYVDLPEAGTYRCFPFAFGQSAAKYIGWGRAYLGYLLPDPDWEALCWGASWKVAKRWLQTVTERHEITIQSPQSQAGNGEIGKTESYSLQCEQDVSDWLEDERFSGTGTKTGFSTVGDSYDSGTYVLGDVARDATDDTLTGRDAADLVRQVAINAGVADELAAHRKNWVRWRTTFQPFIDLTKTVRLNAYGITAKGKVRRFAYYSNIATGDEEMLVELALSRHFGTGLASTSTLTPDDPPDKPDETGIPRRKYLPSHVGGRTDSLPLQESWDGYFTNYTWDATDDNPFAADPSNPQAVFYPEQFICEYPEITGAALDALELPAAQVIDVEIPNDEFTLTQ